MPISLSKIARLSSVALSSMFLAVKQSFTVNVPTIGSWIELIYLAKTGRGCRWHRHCSCAQLSVVVCSCAQCCAQFCSVVRSVVRNYVQLCAVLCAIMFSCAQCCAQLYAVVRSVVRSVT